MFNIVEIFLRIFFPDWKEIFLAVSTDGERNITGQYQGVVTCLGNYPTNMLVSEWCGDHQIDLMMGYIFIIAGKDQFYFVITVFISYLGQKAKLIYDIDTISHVLPIISF